MDAIVVDTEKTGKDCIQYLREQVCKQSQCFLITTQEYYFFYTIIPFIGTLVLTVGMNSDIEIDISYDYWGVLVLVIKSINYYVTGNFSRRNSLI